MQYNGSKSRLSHHSQPQPETETISGQTNMQREHECGNASMLLAAIRQLQQSPGLKNRLKAQYGSIQAPTPCHSQTNNDTKLGGDEPVGARAKKLKLNSEVVK